ncbi:hypothetical protein ACFQV4_29210 [Streptomyces thermocarboxydus]
MFTGPTTALPGAGTEQGADYFVGHGTPRAVTLGTHDASRPTVKVSGVQLGEALKAWAADGDRQRLLVLYSCETGRQPRIAGLPVAQHVANRTGRPVYAPTSAVGTARDKDGNVRAVLVDNGDGPGRWRLFTLNPAVPTWTSLRATPVCTRAPARRTRSPAPARSSRSARCATRSDRTPRSSPATGSCWQASRTWTACAGRARTARRVTATAA